MANKRIYFFEPGKAEGTAEMKELLGGKGANLAEMANLGIPVPPGFTITTEMCTEYYRNHAWPVGLEDDVRASLRRLEDAMGMKFGDPGNPLLVSVRSGARASMPGMMDTILNLGLNDVVAEGLIKKTQNPRFVWDSYRRFLQMYSDVVLEVSRSKFEALIDLRKEKKGVRLDTELTADDWKELVGEFKQLVERELGKPFPQDPWEQLVGAINAVFRSWNNERAIKYRKLNDIPDWWGTAVNVQAMVFGNMGETSGTGVAFTRDARTGERKFFGEYLMNAQGEDVVAGIRTPNPVSQLEQVNPEAYRQLTEIYQKLEQHYRDMMDIEFTIQEGRLYMLQCRVGKRTAMAAVRMAVEMVKEGLIDRRTAVLRVTPKQIDELLHPIIDPNVKVKAVAKGLPASPGAAVGKVVFHAADAEKWVAKGERRVILVRTETSPEDVGGMHVAQGILTARGGMTSHAAVVARGMGKCCVAGCEAIRVNEEERYFTVGEVTVREGDWLTLNGTTGEVILGETPLVEPSLSGDFGTILDWAEEFRPAQPRVRANADTPVDARVAREFGAEGIGLCRTEHMFFAEDRIRAVREMILADDAEERKKPLAKIMPMQKGDFKEIFREMKDLPVTIRLLDPPLHEFLPHDEDQQRALAQEMGKSFDEVRQKVRALQELNPMLGHRGCRLGITFPEIYDMQVQAIFEACCELAKEGLKVVPEVMIPLVGTVEELRILKQNATRVAEEVMQRYGVRVEYSIGTMIEVPRAALVADEIAKEAEFFSFGTNDLTQMTFGYSRDDAGKFLPVYIEQGILEKDPFQSIDQEGVGQLVRMGVERGRQTNPKLKCGICGEHGGDPASIFFFAKAGLDYVSCSPYRVPVARMAAAHAALKEKRS